MRKVTPKSEPLRVLIEADPGSGKTRLADTANQSPLTSPALHLDMRGNTITLAAVPDWPHYVVGIDDPADIAVVYNWLLKGQPKEGPVAEMFPGVEFKTVILDTLTQYHNMELNRITGNVSKKIGQPTKQPKIQDWGELLRRTVHLMGALGDLPIHVIITVQSSEEQDKVTGAILHRPQLWGKSTKEVPAFVYVHAQLVQALRLTRSMRAQMGIPDDVTSETRIALFTPRFDSMAKDQTGRLGSFMVDPTISKMCDLIYPKEPKPS